LSQIQQIASLVAKGDYRKAEVLSSKLFRTGESENDLGAALRLRAKIRLETDRFDEAIEDLRELQNSFSVEFDDSARELFSEAYLARFESAQVGFADRNDLVRAAALLQVIIKANPHYANLGWVYYQLGRIALINNDVSHAKDLLIQALIAPSSNVTLTSYCYERLGFLEYYETRNMWQSLAFLDKAIHTYPNDASPTWLVQVYLLRSRVLREFDTEKAIKSAQTALDIALQSSAHKELIADTAFAASEILVPIQGQEQTLIDQLQLYFSNSKRPVGVDVSWSRAYEMMGDAYTQLEQYERAIAAYESSLSHNPYHPWEESIYYRMAQNLYHQNNYERAIDVLQKVDLTKPVDKSFQFNLNNLLGNAFFALKKYAAAQESYQAALECAPNNIDTQQTRMYLELANERNQPL
jgi:tetratricopeptide (TPR) repeat protein